MFHVMRATSLATLVVASSISAAAASQGPGISAGTASPMVQQAMAILIYGASALAIAYGLIGAVRRGR